MNKTLDLTQGNPGKVLLKFSLPIFMGNLFQQLYTTVDSIVVGNFVGAFALGAVGTTFPITFMVVAVAYGLSNGASILVGQNFGAGKSGNMRKIIHVCIGFSIAAAALLAVLGTFFAPTLLSFMNVAPEIYADALTYLRVYFAGLVFTFCYNMSASIFRSLGDSKTPLMFLAVSSVVNIVLDLVFVLVFGMGVLGVAVATVIAQGVSFVLQMVFMARRLQAFKADELANPPAADYTRKVLGQLCTLALPTTIQEMMIGFGMFIMQSMVNAFGPAASAAYTACTKIENFAMMPMINASIALTAFSAQNMGAGKVDRIKTGHRYAIFGTVALALVMGAVVIAFPQQLLSVFLASGTEQAVYTIGRAYLGVSAISFLCMALTFSNEGVLRGAGDVKLFTVFSIAGMLAKLATATVLVGPLGYRGLFIAVAVGWGSEGLLAALRMRSGKWEDKGVAQANEELEVAAS
ncbi:MATE family efflux transporter [Ruminococcaceae bacterium OttesenSCG-928-N02]|nr:MATE family efflux transporter [Ruminococcaceae bacterium OttesenSCG-928-N02]